MQLLHVRTENVNDITLYCLPMRHYRARVHSTVGCVLLSRYASQEASFCLSMRNLEQVIVGEKYTKLCFEIF